MPPSSVFLRPPVALQQPLRESWDVLCELGRALGMDLDYLGIFPIQREAATAIPALSALSQQPDPEPEPDPVLLGPSRP